MLKQKKFITPQVLTASAYVDVTDWNAATSFTSEAIEFPSTVEWSLDIEGYAGVTPGLPTVTILHSNSLAGEYHPLSTLATNVDITVSKDRMIYSDHFSSRYMKIQYVTGGSTGTFSMILSK